MDLTTNFRSTLSLMGLRNYLPLTFCPLARLTNTRFARHVQVHTLNQLFQHQHPCSLMLNMTQSMMKLINRHLHFRLSCILPLEWASKIYLVKSTLYLYYPDNLPFFVIDLASVTSEDDCRSCRHDTADGDQCDPHCWHIQDILQKDL